MTIRINDDMVITGDMRNPTLCLRASFPSCSGFRQRSLDRRRSNIEIFRGDDLQITFSVLDDNGLPVTINKSQKLRFWIADDNDSVPVIVKERETGGILFSGGIILLGDDYRFRLQLDAVETEPLQVKTYYWEVELYTNNLKTATIAYGDLKIKRDLIRTENEPPE